MFDDIWVLQVHYVNEDSILDNDGDIPMVIGVFSNQFRPQIAAKEHLGIKMDIIWEFLAEKNHWYSAIYETISTGVKVYYTIDKMVMDELKEEDK